MKEQIERAIEHISETNLVRRIFWHMDDKVRDLRYGIQQGDDAIIVGKLVINIEGPYPLKIGRKTGLIHTCSDIVVMGGRPLFALNSIQLDKLDDSKEIFEDLKRQSIGLNVPIIGGNTQLETNLEPCISFTVVGELIGEPISDSNAKRDDRILMLGEIIEGDIGQRIYRAKVKFDTFLNLIKNNIKINASKDCSRGGWFGNLTEMLIKSKKGIQITSVPYPNIGRYMGTYLLSVPENMVKRVLEISARHKCPVVEIGRITDELKISIGDEVFVDEKEMYELIRKFPYKKPKK
ncbi:MAG: hypothetical protein DRO90_00680 [Candidatus Altiarchaeales archaeon]|nr:MAG: hypothetical protein DRO95_02570 [Candidatus Altiarchaeales archaeon]RLI95224.1 MAG: hypothetical protein DRO94_01000 [Candidatus Altiarchaeales archaeon]RLI95258.1 MAG: hypothetical protein DRO90_00680 [Candidatus Altiarchaeales archaeon]HDO82646.1 hypothetical protein [Candidatus Altiarchaeales archaeon]HEX55295.1 hypothetical protein [Candidatus Altiarchaeales archaeon]